MDHTEAKRAVVKIGQRRGFVVKGSLEYRYVITAAHCLPNSELRPRASFSLIADRTFASLLGPLGEKPSIWAECVFLDPISDLAVLASPDNQSLSSEAEKYERFTHDAAALQIADAAMEGHGWLLSLDGRWLPCRATRFSRRAPIWISQAENISGEMSGSPILSDDGAAIGVVVTGSNRRAEDDGVCTEGGPQPVLTRNLPAWLLWEFCGDHQAFSDER
jgi:hypothetical protein